MGIRKYTVLEAMNVQLGQLGFTVISDTDQINGHYSAIQCITDAKFAVLAGNLIDGNPIGITFPAGTIIQGDFTAIALASGSVLAYKGA